VVVYDHEENLTLVTVPSSPFYSLKGRGTRGNTKKVTVLGSWYVPSYVAVRHVVLTPSCDTLSGKAPRGWVKLFLPGRLAFSPSSLGLP
jgi:hypothetical protein